VEELAYADLIAGADLTATIERAFGVDGLGILAVTGVPNLEECRAELLPLAYAFAMLPEEVKLKYETPWCWYAFGWSHGKEKLAGGQMDFSKGSYYNNPQYNTPFEDQETIDRWPSFAHPNIWPSEELPELESAFLNLGRLVVSTGELVAKQCDAFVSQRCPTYKPNLLHDTLVQCKNHKARLLNYFPKDYVAPEAKSVTPEPKANGSSSMAIPGHESAGIDAEIEGSSLGASLDIPLGASAGSHTVRIPGRSPPASSGSMPGSYTGLPSSGLAMLFGSSLGSEGSAILATPRSSSTSRDPFSSWCGWHNDHGSLTGLVSPIYMDQSGQQCPCPDEEAGLYIRNRKGEVVKAISRPGSLLFQIGETAQIHSGGHLQATPHAVRGCKTPGVSRQTFAVFMEPQFDWQMDPPEGVAPQNAQSSAAARSLPAGVPTLASRWGSENCPFSACNFGAFTEVTLNAYH